MVVQQYESIIKYYLDIGMDLSFLELNSITNDEAQFLSQLIKDNDAQNILEVGTSLGISTAIIAFASPSGSIVTIDPNLPLTASAFSKKQDLLPPVIDLTEKMLINFDLQKLIHIIQGYFSCLPSEEQVQFLGNQDVMKPVGQVVGHRIKSWAPYDFAFVDGEHFTKSVLSDLKLMNQYISDKGIIVLHDTDYDWGTFVRKAIDLFVTANPQYRVEIQGNLGILKKQD